MYCSSHLFPQCARAHKPKSVPEDEPFHAIAVHEAAATDSKTDAGQCYAAGKGRAFTAADSSASRSVFTGIERAIDSGTGKR